LPLDLVDFAFDQVWPVSAVGILMQGIVADRTQWRDTSKSPIAGEALGPVGTVL